MKASACLEITVLNYDQGLLRLIVKKKLKRGQLPAGRTSDSRIGICELRR